MGAGVGAGVNPATWYLARAGGVLAYVLITAAVAFGIGLAGRARVPGFPRFAVEDLHRYLGLLAGVFVSLHVAAVLLDSTVPFSLVQALVPFTATYRPLWTGLGVVALELLLALAIANRLRRRMPYRLWRATHTLNFVVWGAATAHGVMSGTDRDQTWLLSLYIAAAAIVAGSTAARLAVRWPGVLASATAAAVVVTALSSVSLPRPPSPASAAVPARFAGPLTGRIDARDGSSARIVSVTGTAGAATRVAFRIDLVTVGGSVSDTSLQLRYGKASVCSGTLAALDTSGFQGSCTFAGGGRRTVQATWSVASGGTVSGRLVAS